MAITPHLTRYASQDVTLLGDVRRPGGVTLAFTERTGGYSLPPYASLNLGDACGDDERVVVANRRRLLGALGVSHLAPRLVNPRQVHGSEVLVITEGTDAAVARAQAASREGADAIVCAAADVPVLLCFADCVPVVLVADGAFAVVHSGWRGTIVRIAARALEQLCEVAGCTPSDVLCYVGPHIGADDYEVHADLAARFVSEFGPEVAIDGCHLDLGRAVRQTLVECGMTLGQISDECPSTASCTRRFFSFRAEGGTCGRIGAIAVLASDADEGSDAR